MKVTLTTRVKVRSAHLHINKARWTGATHTLFLAAS